MKIKFVSIIISLLLLSSGCSTVDDSSFDGEGYIFEVTNDTVLILNNVDPQDIGKEWNDLFETYQGEAIWLRTSTSKLKVGQYVQYWVEGGVNDSFPQQASAKKIKVVEK